MATLTQAPYADLHSVSYAIPVRPGRTQEWLETVLRQSSNWDAEIRPTVSASNSATMLASVLDELQVSALPHLAPSVGGGLQFEYRGLQPHGPRRELDIEILPDGRFGYLMAEAENMDSRDLPRASLPNVVPHLIAWVFRSR